MKQKSGALAFIVSAIILWLLSHFNLLGVSLGGNRTWVTILLVALVLGIINWIVVSLVRSMFKKGSPVFLFIIALVVDAVALWLTAVIVSNFNVGSILQTIIVAAILAAVCSVAGLVKD